MTPEKHSDLKSLEGDIREALTTGTPVAGPDCPDLVGLLDAIESVDAGREPDALEHIAVCGYCRREYLRLRDAFSEADRLRSGAAAEAVRPARRRLAEMVRSWLSPLVRTPALRPGLAAAGMCAAAVFGYVLGAGSVHHAPPAIVGPQPAPDAEARLGRLSAELNSARAEIRRLKRLSVKPPTPIAPRRAAVVLPVIRAVTGLGRPLLRVVAPAGLIARESGVTAAFSPAATWVLSDRPAFRCRFPGAGLGTRYSIRVMDPSGGTLTAETTGPALMWRPGHRLPRGKMIAWTVSARVRDRDYTATGRFGVLTEDEVQRVRAAVAASRGIERAMVYLRAGLLPEAAAVLEKVPASSRDYAMARRELAKIRIETTPRLKWIERQAPAVDDAGAFQSP